MARHGYYDEKYGFVPYDDCPQDNLYSESEAKHTFSPSEPITNAGRIRAMTDEELAEYLDGVCHDLWQMFVKDPKKMWLEWLKQEAKE